MNQIFSKSVLLLMVSVVLCCVIYPIVLWIFAQTFFPFQANGSILKDGKGHLIGSKWIAQPFTKDEYFHPRPSAASYDAAASASSSLAASNYLLRDRVARTLGLIVKYRRGPKAGREVKFDIENWFQHDTFHGSPHIVAQWATLHPALAEAWVKADPISSAYVENWAKSHSAVVARFIESHPNISHPTSSDLAVEFFKDFSITNPGKFPSLVGGQGTNDKSQKSIAAVATGSEIQSRFFEMWLYDHPHEDLENIPGDLVTTSASGLDPDITLQNAEYQLDRVSHQWAFDLKRDPKQVREEIEIILQKMAFSPWGGWIGEKLISVLEINLELNKHFQKPISHF